MISYLKPSLFPDVVGFELNPEIQSGSCDLKNGTGFRFILAFFVVVQSFVGKIIGVWIKHNSS
ncbi:hypothetical protein F951_03122 [Acinetobacter soli CIP 110264]|nr:hypothetical protein F951_03122 [Acinetobacter soli CIP 110264]